MLLILDKINYPSLIKLSNQLYACTHEFEVYAALLHSIMGKLASQRAMIVQHTSTDKVSVLYSIGKNPFSYSTIDSPINDIELSIVDGFYQHRYDFRSDENETFSLFFTFMRSDNLHITTEQSEYIALVTKISSAAIRNIKNIAKIKDAKQKTELSNFFLKSLMQVNQDLLSVTSVDAVVQIFYHTILGQLGITKVALFIIDQSNNFIQHKNSFGIDFPDEMLNRFYRFDESSNKKDLGISCDLCNIIEYYIPIKYNGRKHGFILFGKKYINDDFSEQEIMFAEGLASATMGAMIKEHLVDELIEKKNIEKELDIALEIQNNLMPKSSPIIEGYAICADSIPSRQVGGDYYDIIKITDKKYLFIIADVSGKGIPAALLMANVQAACRVMAPLAQDLNHLLNSVNKLIFQNTTPERFVTMFACVLDLNANKLKYSNAGHNPPLYINSNSEVKRLDKGGIILGLFDEDIDYKCETIDIEPDSILILYTDGIVECPNNLDLNLGEEKLADFIKDNYSLPPSDIMRGIFSSISNTTGNKINYDDQTLILIKRN